MHGIGLNNFHGINGNDCCTFFHIDGIPFGYLSQLQPKSNLFTAKIKFLQGRDTHDHFKYSTGSTKRYYYRLWEDD
ncbi:hypothetical protein D3C85_1381690 [compost metagenome]